MGPKFYWLAISKVPNCMDKVQALDQECSSRQLRVICCLSDEGRLPYWLVRVNWLVRGSQCRKCWFFFYLVYVNPILTERYLGIKEKLGKSIFVSHNLPVNMLKSP